MSDINVLDREYHGCRIISTPGKFQETRDGRGVPTGNVACDGFDHEVHQGGSRIGTFFTLADALAAAKKAHGPYDTPTPFADEEHEE
jgi:hypothetical protein